MSGAGADALIDAAALRRAQVRLELNDLLGRYTRAVDSLSFDRLGEVFASDAVVHYRWLPLGLQEYSSITLRGVVEIQEWLAQSLDGRPELRRYLSGLDVLECSAGHAVATVQMHERGMRITGLYRLEAAVDAAGWRLRRLDLTEEIQWAAPHPPVP